MMVDPLDNLTSSAQLRRLLLQEEQERIEKLEVRVGDDDALTSSLVPIIADVLRDAGVKDYRRLADALAPIVLQSIKTEIHNSRDMMVDALYPITGRLVAAAVRNAFRDLVEQLNTRLDSTLSVDRWRAKVKAKVSGRSEAEILLSEGAAFEIVDLLLINRQSGLLITQAGLDADQGGMESHLMSSILTAIMAFVRDAMSQSSEQDLRTLHVGDMRLHLQVSPGAILAIKTKGPPPAGFDTALGETFYAFLSRWGDALSDPDNIEKQDEIALSEDLDERFQSLLKAKQTNFRGASKKGAVLLGALASIAFLWIGWTIYDGWSAGQIEARAQSVLDQRSELRGYPIEARYGSDDTLTISGLLPSQEALETLRGELQKALPDVSLSLDVGKLPEWRETASDETYDGLDNRLSLLSKMVAGIEQRLPASVGTREAAFRAWVDRQSISLKEDGKFDDEAVAGRMLEEMVDRFSNVPDKVGLRIIVYGDDLAEERVNDSVSSTGVALVANKLLALGMPGDRLQIAGRGKEQRFIDVNGPDRARHRVEFELSFLPDRKPSPGADSGADDGAR